MWGCGQSPHPHIYLSNFYDGVFFSGLRDYILTNLQANLDTLPAFCQARVLILGVGNLLFGDDGFGPAVADTLLRNYVIPEEIYVMDAGTGVRKLLFTLTLSEDRPEEIVIVDAVDWDQEKGRVLDIPVDKLPVTKIDDFSLHQVPTSNMLRELQDQCAVKVSVLACDVGIIPQRIQPGLSPLIQEAVISASQKIAERFSMRHRGGKRMMRRCA